MASCRIRGSPSVQIGHYHFAPKPTARRIDPNRRGLLYYSAGGIRMKRWLVRLAALGAFTLQFGCTQAPPPDTRAVDEKAIRDGEAQWAKEMAAKDVEKNVAH